MNLVHLTASTFFGGPERQILGLAQRLRDADDFPEPISTTIASFAERGRCQAFVEEIRTQGFDAIRLANDFPSIRATLRELSQLLDRCQADVLFCHGYKADILGRIAARRVGIPAVAVSRGWTAENRKVRVYEWLDRRNLRFMDHVVCVSEGQAEKVRRWCSIPEERLSVIRNAARFEAASAREPASRERLLSFFHPREAVAKIVLAAGRLSPEKGFGVLVEAAAAILRNDPATGFVLFGEGVLRPELERRIAELGIARRFLMPGFRHDLDALIGAADIVALPSFTEGLPNVALEASAAGVPVVATAVGGTPEVIADGVSGFLVPAGNPALLAAKVCELLGAADLRRSMGNSGRSWMRTLFTFEAQAASYMELIDRLIRRLHGTKPRMRQPVSSPI
ncbi:MAG TPA: glycosyltransferase [Urbifossiella sp.]|nr:glycosyltransferase [Urbifossiella sp.]